MRVFFSASFEKQYRKLSRQLQTAADRAILKFQQDPFDPTLRNHPLKGKLAGLRSIKAGYDLRIVYEEDGGHITIYFLSVGSHDQVY